MIQNKSMLSLLKEIEEQKRIKDYLFVLYGKLDQEMVVSTIELIDKKMNLEKFTKSIITRVKLVCIEILQNIVKHQQKHEEIFPYFILGTYDHSLTIFSGNVIDLTDKKNISERLNRFISLDDSSFRENYKNELKNAVISEDGNVGMGLLDIVYRSNKNITYHIDDISQNLFSFNLNVSINS